jgi:hypothetical protein
MSKTDSSSVRLGMALRNRSNILSSRVVKNNKPLKNAAITGISKKEFFLSTGPPPNYFNRECSKTSVFGTAS